MTRCHRRRVRLKSAAVGFVLSFGGGLAAYGENAEAEPRVSAVAEEPAVERAEPAIRGEPIAANQVAAAVKEIWVDAVDTWARLQGRNAYGGELPHLAVVSKVKGEHCYGLYVNGGPVYCSGNNTVFLSVDEMQRLDARLPDFGEAGLAFLISHELGHHIQKTTGRFRLLAMLMRANAAGERDLVRRFELEADCLSGIWAAHSQLPLASADRRRALAKVAEVVGDDRVKYAGEAPANPEMFTHGTADQRRHWFEVGLAAKDLDACNVLQSSAY